jgi:6,7-dimethyl-8-ribityllumazine synthase
VTIDIDGLDGELPDGYVAVVASRYHESISENLLSGALQTLREAGVPEDRIVVARVAGAWELALPAMNFAMSAPIIGVVALGAVIRGETTHDQHINRAVSTALMNASIDSDTPIALGLLTCNNVEQAVQRSGGSVGNKGVEAAQALLESMRLAEKMRQMLSDDEDTEEAAE